MKTELTIEQSQRLIELGVRTEKASEYKVVGSTCPSGIGGQVMMDRPIFTLTDLLKILPKEIVVDGDEYYVVYSACYPGGEWGAHYESKWSSTAEYVGKSCCMELIDALYELTIFCIENKLIKL